MVDPNERRRERARARRVSMTAEQRDIINKHRRDAYHAKKQPKMTMSTEEKKEKVNQNKRASRRRIKDIRSDTLHPDSIAIENPHFEPKLISPNTLNEPVSPCDLEIPILHGGTGYIPSTLEDPPQEAEPSILVGKKGVPNMLPLV